MPNTIIKQLKENENLRNSLSQLRQLYKEPKHARTILAAIQENPELVLDCLTNEDAKTRKNAALLMGELSLPSFAKPLFDAYLRENQLFVKSSYLVALKNYDCSPFINQIRNKLEELSKLPLTVETKKHLEEEMRSLSQLIILEDGMDMHNFAGFHKEFDCILLGNKENLAVLEREIPSENKLLMRAGVRVKTDQIAELLDIRCYHELLFIIPGFTACSMNPEQAAKDILQSKLMTFLTDIHKEPAPFYFRIEVKSKMPLAERSSFAKKLSYELEHLSKRNLINSTSNYEIELRLIENKTGHFNVLLKLFTLFDKRFNYRKEHIATSIKPVDAALFVQLAKEYMKPDSRTLDPFCGVGTMLIERQKVIKGNTSYGIDSFTEAIEKARINMEAANQVIHFVNKSCIDFSHEYQFDEIFTNMPFATNHVSEEEIRFLYKAFFSKSKEWLKEDGTIIMHTQNKNYVDKLIGLYDYEIAASFLINKKNDNYLLVLIQKNNKYNII